MAGPVGRVWWQADPQEDMVSILVQNPTLANATQQSAGGANAATAAPRTMRMPTVVAFINQAYEAIEA